MAERSVTFEVGITFCSGRSFSHDHESLEEAMREYSTLLGAAIDPSLLTEPDAKHIRMLNLICRDAAGEITQEIYSPVFPCEDQTAA
jgi:hypothetical protein